MASFVLLSRSSRTHWRATTFSEQVIASITDANRSGMSDIAFRTSPPIGWLSCQQSVKVVEVPALLVIKAPSGVQNADQTFI